MKKKSVVKVSAKVTKKNLMRSPWFLVGIFVLAILVIGFVGLYPLIFSSVRLGPETGMGISDTRLVIESVGSETMPSSEFCDWLLGKKATISDRVGGTYGASERQLFIDVMGKTIISEVCNCDKKPGDANGDGKIDVSDATVIGKGSYICASNADANGNCKVEDEVDARYLTSYLFEGGPSPKSCSYASASPSPSYSSYPSPSPTTGY